MEKIMQLTYNSKQLSSSRWQARRTEILKRDKHTCLICSSTQNLHVHHTDYIGAAWETPDDSLATLCAACHIMEHFLLKKQSELRGTSERWTIVIYKHPTLGELIFVPGAPDGADMAINKDKFGEYFAIDVNEFIGL
jgi:hypothetical protein